jgi:hypothetical protein
LYSYQIIREKIKWELPGNKNNTQATSQNAVAMSEKNQRKPTR